MITYFSIGALICAGVAATTDLRTGRIPNWLTYGTLAAGLTLRGFLGGWSGLREGFAGALVGGALLFPLFLVRGMGAGDVKLMTALGCLVGWQRTVTLMIATAMAGGVLAIGYMVLHKRVSRTFRNLGELLKFRTMSGVQPHPEINLEGSESIKLPYAVAIACGTLYSVGQIFLSR